MEDILKQKLDARIELIGGSGGVFDVKVDGKLIYSKAQTGRFPEPAEIIEKISR